MNKPKIEVVSDVEKLARRSLELFIESAKKSIDGRGIFHVAISGGHTPKRFFELLGESAEAKALVWDKVQLFWVDERYVAPDSAQSNFKLAADTFLGKAAIPRDNIFRILTEYKNINLAAREYEQIIRVVFGLKQNQLPQFDMIFLGLGADGHIASLFSGNDTVLKTDKPVAVVENVKPARITLTGSVLCAAASLAILVSGQEKSQILKQIFTVEPDAKKYPVHILWPVLDKVTWLVDSQAAKQIATL